MLIFAHGEANRKRRQPSLPMANRELFAAG